MKARAVQKDDATIEIFADNPDESYRLIDGTSQLLMTYYNWNATNEFEVNESADLRIWINDTDYYDEGEFVLVDQIMLVRIGFLEENTTSDADDTVEFDGQGDRTIYIRLTLDDDIPLYVGKARIGLKGLYGLDNIIENGGFETSDLTNWDWKIVGTGDLGVDDDHHKEGDYSAYMNADHDSTIYLYQNMTIPSNAESAWVEWWDRKAWIYDYYNVSIRNDQGEWLETLFQSGVLPWTSWVHHNHTLSSTYIGQTIQLCFMNQNTAANNIYEIGIDGVKLVVVVPPYPTNPTLKIGESGNESSLLWQHDSGPFTAEEITNDLSGEFNRYISLNLNSSSDHIDIPLTFHSDTRGRIEIVHISVLLEPFVSSPFFNDTDSDNLTDYIEAKSYTSSLKTDSDNDGWTDRYEIHTVYNVTSGSTDQTSPVDSDTDDDGEMDSEDDNPTIADVDRDGLLDGTEKYLGTNASDPDTDDDGLLDGRNITVETDSWRYNHFVNHSIYHINNSDNTTTFFGEISLGTNSVTNDTDFDGLLDGNEIVSENSTDPKDPDSDNDFLLDGSNITVENGNDPRHQHFQENHMIRFGNVYVGELSFGTNQSSVDSDEDTLPDGWEVRFGLNPADNATLNHSSDGDPDNDELTNIQEFFYRTHPRKWDSDGDSLPDAWETHYGLDPLWNNTTRLLQTINWSYDAISEQGSAHAGYGDLDRDNLFDINEFRYNLSNPETYNATGDGVYWNGTSPVDPDSDGDGLLDGLNRTITKTHEVFQKWATKNIKYIENDNGSVTFVGETSLGTNCLFADTDGDGATDGQEIFGYTVIVTWYEKAELKSEEKTVYGDPLKKFMEPDGTTPLDVDGDTIPDLDEVDPWNSTDYGYYVNHPELNETDVENQFNPYIKENTPPRILTLKINKKEKWGWVVIGIVPAYVCTHAWTEISVEVIDVADFAVEIRVDDYSDRFDTFEGQGHAWFEAALDLDYWMDVLADYTVKISAEDNNGNVLDPPLKKVVEGLFGGILRILSDFIEWIVGIAQSIAEAILEALNFLLDLILDAVTWTFEVAIRPILDSMKAWASDVVGKFMALMEEQGKDNYTEKGLSELTSTIFGGSLFYVLVGVVTAISIVVMFATPFLSVFSILLGVLGPLLTDSLMGLIGATMSVDSLVSSVQGASGLMSVYQVVGTLWNTPDIVLETLNLLFWLFSLWASKTSLLMMVGEGLPFVMQAAGFVASIIGATLSLSYFNSESDEAQVASTTGVLFSALGLFLVWKYKASIPLWNYICLGIASGSLAASTAQAIASYT